MTLKEVVVQVPHVGSAPAPPPLSLLSSLLTRNRLVRGFGCSGDLPSCVPLSFLLLPIEGLPHPLFQSGEKKRLVRRHSSLSLYRSVPPGLSLSVKHTLVEAAG